MRFPKISTPDIPEGMKKFFSMVAIIIAIVICMVIAVALCHLDYDKRMIISLCGFAAMPMLVCLGIHLYLGLGEMFPDLIEDTFEWHLRTAAMCCVAISILQIAWLVGSDVFLS